MWEQKYVLDDVYLTKEQVTDILNYLQKINDEIIILGLDKNNEDDKMRILCYLYTKLQKEIKYYHPREITGYYDNPSGELTIIEQQMGLWEKFLKYPYNNRY